MAAIRPAHAPRTARPRRWIAWLVAAVVLLGGYTYALRWVTLKVESGVQASVHPLATDAEPVTATE